MPHSFREQLLTVDDQSIFVVEAGEPGRPVAMLLHGWPENWEVFRNVMVGLASVAHVVAIDLPGIGRSSIGPVQGDKKSLAGYLRNVISRLGLKNVSLVGHDVGGQITYAYLKAYPNELSRAVIMNVAIPGIEPWEQVKRNPHIWHFAFHAVPGQPEELVSGREAAYFDFFYDAISAEPQRITASQRRAYAHAYERPEALRTGFEWYRSFEKDESDNLATKAVKVNIPVLYVRGDRESGRIEDYAAGLIESGFGNLQTATIPNCGHFAPNEQPWAVVSIIGRFMNLTLNESAQL